MREAGRVEATASDSHRSRAEQRGHGGMVDVRDTNDRSGTVLRLTSAEFAAWLDGAKRGEFDHLV